MQELAETFFVRALFHDEKIQQSNNSAKYKDIQFKERRARGLRRSLLWRCAEKEKKKIGATEEEEKHSKSSFLEREPNY